MLWCANAVAGDVKLGVVLPLSGPHERLGRAALDGVEWAQTLYDTPLELVIVDSQGTPEGAAEALRQLAGQPDVAAVLGPIGAEESRAAAEVAAEEDIPLITLTSAEGIEDLGREIFRGRVSPEAQSRALARLAFDSLGLRRAAVFHPDDAYGGACARAFVDAFVAAGGEVRALETYPPDESKPDTEAELLTGRRLRKAGRQRKKVETKKRRHAIDDIDVLFIPDHGGNVARSLAFLELAGLP